MEQEIGSILQRFIVSKESEAIISGLNILGAFCGFGQEMPPDYDFPFEEKGNFFKRNSQRKKNIQNASCSNNSLGICI